MFCYPGNWHMPMYVDSFFFFWGGGLGLGVTTMKVGTVLLRSASDWLIWPCCWINGLQKLGEGLLGCSFYLVLAYIFCSHVVTCIVWILLQTNPWNRTFCFNNLTSIWKALPLKHWTVQMYVVAWIRPVSLRCWGFKLTDIVGSMFCPVALEHDQHVIGQGCAPKLKSKAAETSGQRASLADFPVTPLWFQSRNPFKHWCIGYTQCFSGCWTLESVKFHNWSIVLETCFWLHAHAEGDVGLPGQPATPYSKNPNPLCKLVMSTARNPLPHRTATE